MGLSCKVGSKRVIACADVELLEVEEVYWIKRCAAISCSQSSAFIHILLFFLGIMT